MHKNIPKKKKRKKTFLGCWFYILSIKCWIKPAPFTIRVTQSCVVVELAMQIDKREVKSSGYPAFLENYTIENIINNFSQILKFVSYKQINPLRSRMKLQAVELWRQDALQNVPTELPDNHCDLTKLLRESQKHTEAPYQQSPYPGNHKTGKISFFP